MRDAMRDDAWDAIVALDREHGQRLYGYALRLGVDSGRAADLVQEALLRLWRELGRGTAIASREAWTYRALSRAGHGRAPPAPAHRAASSRVLGDRPAPQVMEVDSTERVAIWSAGRPVARPPATGHLPALPGRPVVRGDRTGHGHRARRRPLVRDGRPPDPAQHARRWSRPMMDDTTLERGLRARPPADPVYLSRITALPPAARRAARGPEHGLAPDRLRRPAVSTWLVGVLAVLAIGMGAFLVVADRPVPVTPVASPSPSLDPFAGFVTQEVEPGVLRLVNDGFREIFVAAAEGHAVPPLRQRHRAGARRLRVALPTGPVLPSWLGADVPVGARRKPPGPGPSHHRRDDRALGHRWRTPGLG